MENIPEDYFEKLGSPNPKHDFTLLDAFRFKAALDLSVGEKILDVGAYLGTLIHMARRRGFVCNGTEVNSARVNLANERLGQGTVSLAFRNGDLSPFPDNSFDTTICLEVLEHVPDHAFALAELCRVSRRRVVIAVPFREKIINELCLHCHNTTPRSGHLHRYDFGSWDPILPTGWLRKKERALGGIVTSKLLVKTSVEQPDLSIHMASVLDRILPLKRRWMLTLLEKNPE